MTRVCVPNGTGDRLPHKTLPGVVDAVDGATLAAVAVDEHYLSGCDFIHLFHISRSRSRSLKWICKWKNHNVYDLCLDETMVMIGFIGFKVRYDDEESVMVKTLIIN